VRAKKNEDGDPTHQRIPVLLGICFDDDGVVYERVDANIREH
jgi:hypothetical protein